MPQSTSPQSQPHSPTAALANLGLVLPSAPKPVASYVPCVRTGNLLIVSGQLPFRDGKLLATGLVPDPVTIERGQEAARQCILNGLAVVAAECGGSLDCVARIVRLGVFVASCNGFTEQPKVANGASDLLQQIFGESGRHARAAVGTNALPLGASVEIEMMVELRDRVGAP
ncbi:MAG: RidA family protein [Planctomycetes bacterium]|nr:RidA family protein [Planctomycetota bacterium]